MRMPRRQEMSRLTLLAVATSGLVSHLQGKKQQSATLELKPTVGLWHESILAASLNGRCYHLKSRGTAAAGTIVVTSWKTELGLASTKPSTSVPTPTPRSHHERRN